jgi:hypothetical protein
MRTAAAARQDNPSDGTTGEAQQRCHGEVWLQMRESKQVKRKVG